MTAAFQRFAIDGPAGRLQGWTYGGDEGSGTPILFIHPINLAGACWKDVASALDPVRYGLMPDMRGHGASDPAGPYGVDQWATDCFAVLDAFEVSRAHLVGGSLGGPIAVAMAAGRPDRVASITAFGSALAIEGGDLEAVLTHLREKGVKGMFREVIPEISVAPSTAQEVIERILEIANPNDVDTVYEIWAETISSDVRERAADVECPALIVNGEFDKTCTPEQGDEMARALRTKLVKMASMGHLPMIEDPRATAELISDFLNEVEANVPSPTRTRT